MIQNPHIQAYRYDPYPKVLSIENYDLPQMMQIRHDAIEKAKSAQRFGIILGTLGRQGNPIMLNHLKEMLEQQGKEYFILLLSEIFPEKVGVFPTDPGNTKDANVNPPVPIARRL